MLPVRILPEPSGISEGLPDAAFPLRRQPVMLLAAGISIAPGAGDRSPGFFQGFGPILSQV
jgi:hypothetical protein